MTRRTRRGTGAGHIVTGLALASLLLMITSLCHVLTQGNP